MGRPALKESVWRTAATVDELSDVSDIDAKLTDLRDRMARLSAERAEITGRCFQRAKWRASHPVRKRGGNVTPALYRMAALRDERLAYQKEQ